jgi:hypothetical protein
MNQGWPNARPADAIRSVLFFGLLYLYFWLAVEPCLIYGCATITNFPVFYRGWPFLWECLSWPGGLLQYLCALLPQFFYYSWAGALVITGQAWALFACMDWFLRSLGVPASRLLRFVPTLLVLVTYAQYSYHFPTITGALALLLFACLYIAVVSRARREPAGCAMHTSFLGRMRSWCAQHTLQADVAAYLALSVVSYIVGAAAYLPFAVLCVIYELLYRRRYAVGLAYGLFAGILPYVMGVLVFRVSILSAYTDLLPWSWQIRGWATREKTIAVVYALHLFPIAVALVWGLWRVVGRRSSSPKGKARRGVAKQRLAWLRGPAVKWTMGSVLLFAGVGVIAVLVLDRPQKALLAMHHYTLQRRWPEVLQVARRCPESYPVMNAVNRALYHTDRLNRDMFRYPQHPEALMLTGEDHSVLYWHKFDVLIDLGLVNLAEKNLVECLEMFGAHPLILQRLVLVNLAKGKIEAGRIYLGALHKMLFFRTWARDYLAHLDADPTLASDPQIRPLRARVLQKDSTVFFFAQEPMLRALVEQGGGNRMAFEYLMAWYLLTKQSDKVVQNLSCLPEFGYTDIPPLYQEAAVIYAYGTKKPLPLGGLAEAQRRIEHFSSIFNRYGRDKAAAFPELARDYAGSYFFYFIYASIER